MDEQTRLIRKEIKAAQDHQKHYADAKRSDCVFKEGDMVFLIVRPKRSSLSLGKYKKLSPRYCGPYTIVRHLPRILPSQEEVAHLVGSSVIHWSHRLIPWVSYQRGF